MIVCSKIKHDLSFYKQLIVRISKFGVFFLSFLLVIMCTFKIRLGQMGKADENGLLNFIHICTLDYPERIAVPMHMQISNQIGNR